MLLDKNLSVEIPIDEAHPVLHFQYRYPQSFTTIAQAFINKYNYESRSSLTTATGVQQLDEDRFMFYRRVDSVFSNDMSYERVIIDRRNGGQITSELIKERPGGERLFERGTLNGVEGADGVQHNHLVFDH
jgi:hypothetical protein